MKRCGAYTAMALTIMLVCITHGMAAGENRVPKGFAFNNAVEYKEYSRFHGGTGTVRFKEYSVEAAYVREQYADGDESKQAVNHGIYVTVGYEF